MKRQAKNLLLSLGLVLFISLVACSSDKKTAQHADTADSHAATIAKVEPEFKDAKIKQVYSDYIQLKNALIEADAAKAKTAAAKLQSSLTAVSNKKAADLSGKIASASSIAAQRAQLDLLSAELEKVVKGSKLSAGTVYKQYCPMANGGKGGFWLSSESEIRNPYYGDEMMNCGSVDEEIK